MTHPFDELTATARAFLQRSIAKAEDEADELIERAAKLREHATSCRAVLAIASDDIDDEEDGAL